MTNETGTTSDSPSSLRRALQLIATLAVLLLVGAGCANTPLANDAVVDQGIDSQDVAEDSAEVDAPSESAAIDEESAVAPPATVPEGWDPFGGGANDADGEDASNGAADSDGPGSEDAPSENAAPEPVGDAVSVNDDSAAPTTASVPETLAFSADATAEYSTMLFSFDVQMGLSGEVLEMNGQGAIDGQTMALQMNLDGLLDSMAGEVDRETARLFEEPMVLIADNTNVFVKWSPLTELNGHGDKWIYVPVDVDAVPVVDPTLFDPATFFDLMYGASSDVIEVGTKQLDGVTVTGYSGTFSVADQAEFQNAANGSSGAAELGDATTTVWISEDSIVRQIETDFVMLGLAYRSSMTFSAFGEPVNITVPSLADAISADEIEGFLE